MYICKYTCIYISTPDMQTLKEDRRLATKHLGGCQCYGSLTQMIYNQGHSQEFFFGGLIYDIGIKIKRNSKHAHVHSHICVCVKII